MVFGAWVHSEEPGTQAHSWPVGSAGWTTRKEQDLRWAAPTCLTVPGFLTWQGQTTAGEVFVALWADGQVSNPAAIGHEWAKRGKELVTGLTGPFSCVLYDFRGKTLFGARDALGLRPLLVYHNEGTAGLLGSVGAAWEIPGFAAQLNIDWAVPFLHATVGEGLGSAVTGIEHVPPGHSVTINNSEITVEPFYSLQGLSPRSRQQEKQDLASYRTSLVAAIETVIPDTGPIAVESSGGIDSGAILAVASASGRAQAKRIHALTYEVFEQERPRVASVNSCFPGVIEKSWPGQDLYSGDISQAQERAWDALGYPAEHTNSAAHVLFYEYAEAHGISTLLSGFGGDEGVSSQAFHQIEELWREGRLWAAAGAAGMGKARSRIKYIVRRLFAGGSLESFSHDYVAMIVSLSVLSDSALAALEVQERLSAASSTGSQTRTINDYVVAQLTSKHSWARVIESSLIAATYGVDYRYPLLDLDLVRVYLETPSVWKRNGSVGRYLHRKAIEDWLPHDIVWNTPKAAGELISQPAHPIDVEGAEEYLDRLITNLPERLRLIVDPEKVRALVEASGEREKFYARHILSRLDELSRWMRAYNVT